MRTETQAIRCLVASVQVDLKAFGLEQHIQHVGKNQQGNDEEEREHTSELNAFKPVNDFVKEGEAAQCRSQEEQNREHE